MMRLDYSSTFEWGTTWQTHTEGIFTEVPRRGILRSWTSVLRSSKKFSLEMRGVVALGG